MRLARVQQIPGDLVFAALFTDGLMKPRTTSAARAP